MYFKVFSKFPIGFSGFQIVFSKCVSKCFQKSPIGFKVFSNYVFKNVFKIPHDGFQIVHFKVLSNNVFQSVFKSPHRF